MHAVKLAIGYTIAHANINQNNDQFSYWNWKSFAELLDLCIIIIIIFSTFY